MFEIVLAVCVCVCVCVRDGGGEREEREVALWIMEYCMLIISCEYVYVFTFCRLQYQDSRKSLMVSCYFKLTFM